MQFQFNCYEVLGVAFNSNQQEIKAGYRKASLKAHPDTGGSNEEQIRVNAAYEILADPVQKNSHDTYWGNKSQYNSKTKSFRARKKTYTKANQRSSYSYSQRSSSDQKWNSEGGSNESLEALKRRFYEETESKKDGIWKGMKAKTASNERKFSEEFSEGKKSIGKYFVYSMGFAFVGLAFPLLFIGTAINAWLCISNLYGVEVRARRFSVFDPKVGDKIAVYAKEQTERECQQEVDQLDSGWQALASLSELLLKESGFDESEQQVARRIAASLFLMGYRPQNYYQDSRTFTFTDGDEKLAVRFRHRKGQATNVTYVKTLHSIMQGFGADKGLLFCSPGLSGNAAIYAKKAGINSYSLEQMNEWIESVLTADYDGPRGDLYEGLVDLKQFISRISTPLPFRRKGYRKRYRRYG